MPSNRRYNYSVYSINSCEALTAAIASVSQSMQNQCTLDPFFVIISYSATLSLAQVRQLQCPHLPEISDFFVVALLKFLLHCLQV